jgi:ribose transport system permease protein
MEWRQSLSTHLLTESKPKNGTTPGGRKSSASGAGALLRSYGSLIALIILIIYGATTNGSFLTVANAGNVITQNSSLAIIAFGLTLLIAAGEFDLSVGAIYALGSVVFADMSNHMPIVVAAILTLLIGLIAGVINGLLVTRLNINSFIATLATGLAFTGIAYLISNGQAIYVTKPGFTTLGTGTLGNIPYIVIIVAVVLILMEFLIRGTVFGIHLRAVGGNRSAAYLTGLRVNLNVITAFAIVGVCGALAALLRTSQLGVGQVDSSSATLALNAIAVVVIGGTSLRGGEGSVLRTAVGFLILAVLQNIFNILALSSYWSLIVSGIVIIAAVAIDAIGSRRKS